MPLDSFFAEKRVDRGGQARRRLASDLHDDAFRISPAAELRLQTLFDSDGKIAEELGEIQPLLSQTEDASAGCFSRFARGARAARGFEETLRDRVQCFARITGIGQSSSSSSRTSCPYDSNPWSSRQVAEAPPTVEKHAAAPASRSP